jgi:uncharacterized DUF497 family protein
VEIGEFAWLEGRVDHISRHGVLPEEVEEVCFGEALVQRAQRARSSGANPVYFGETSAGRHLFCLVIQFPDGKGFPVTAREMTPKEKKRYKRWKKH